MQCPKCNTNIYGNIDKCSVCGFSIQNNTSNDQTNISNGILDPTNYEDYTKKVHNYMNGYNNNNKVNNSNESKLVTLIIFMFVIIIGVIIAIISLLF